MVVRTYILFASNTSELRQASPFAKGPPKKNPKAGIVDLCQRINPEIQVQPIAQRFGRSSGRTLPILGKLAVFLCVDTIQGRKRIWEGVRQEASFLADGRMSAEVMRVLAVPDPGTDTNYDQTLFRPEQAYAGSCTAKATIYTASIAAGLMMSQFTRWLRGMPVERDLTLNLLAAELSV